MKAQSNIKPASIQYLVNNTSYININVVEIEGMYNYESLLIVGDVTYEKVVVALLREKYSLNDEIAISNNRMSIFDANLLPKEKEEEYNREYYAYQVFREECKRKAREICRVK